MNGLSYILITAAKNEAANIGETLEAVCSQTVKPVKWIIIDDGSTDNTLDVIEPFRTQYDFIVSKSTHTRNSKCNFSSKVHAINAGLEEVKGIDYDLLGIVDADISFQNDYYEQMLKEFENNPNLGIGGGQVYDVIDDELVRRFPSPHSVSGGIQLFRKKCYDEIGGLPFLKHGGEDTVAEMTAKMKGWKVLTFMELTVSHHKCTGVSQGNPIVSRFKLGFRDYIYGSHPIFEAVKCVRQLRARPVILAGLLRFMGFMYFFLKNEKRPVSQSLIEYVQRDQLDRLKLRFLASYPLGDPVFFNRIIKIVISILYLPALMFFFRISGKKRCVVLTYHGVTEEKIPGFERQMQLVKKYTSSLDVLSLSAKKSGKWYSLLTFDDGFRNVYLNALPFLEKLQLPAVLFVPSHNLGKKPQWLKNEEIPDKEYVIMNEDEVKECNSNRLFIIGSHSKNHFRLTESIEQQAVEEIQESGETLKELLHEDIHYFSFPHGAYKRSHIKAAMRCHYKAVFSMEPSLFYPSSDSFVIGRIRVDPDEWPIEFLLKLYGAYSWFAVVQKTGALFGNVFTRNKR